MRLIKNFGDDILYWNFIILTVHMHCLLGFCVPTQCPWACSAALQLFHDKAVGWCIGEYCPYKNMCPPQWVPDHSAAAQVLDLESQVTVSVVRLKQCVVGVWAKELRMNTHIYHEVFWSHPSLKKNKIISNCFKGNTVIFFKTESTWSAAFCIFLTDPTLAHYSIVEIQDNSEWVINRQ